jgi:hypothetical protein
MEVQEIRIAWFVGLALLWLGVLLIGGALAALARALDHAREVIAARKLESEPRAEGGVQARAGDAAALIRSRQAAWRLRC